MAAAAVVVPLAALAAVSPVLPVSEMVGAALSFAVASAVIVGPVSLCPLRSIAPPRIAALVALAGMVVSIASLKLPAVVSGLVGSLGVVGCGIAVGASVGIRVASAGHLLAVALVSAAVDFWSVNAPSGVTHAIVANPVLLQVLTVRAAVPHGGAAQPTIGFGDVVFAALYATTCAKFGLSARRTTVALAAGLLAAGAAAMAIGSPGGVPALPFLGAAVVAAHPQSRTLAPQDRAPTAVVALVLAAAVVRFATR